MKSENNEDIYTHLLLLGLHLGDGIDVVLMADLALPGAQGYHASLDADGLQHGATELVGAARELAPVDGGVDTHLAGMDLQDLGARLLVGQGKLDLTVEPAGTQQRWVQYIYPVRRRQHFDTVIRGKAVELVQKLQHRPLHFTVATLFTVEPLRAHRVKFVNENDGRGLLLGQGEAIANELSTIPYKHLHELGAGELEECGVGLGCAGSGQKCLAGTGRAVHQGTCMVF